MAEIESNKSALAFDRLRSLVGQWRDINGTTIVEYRESAYGSIVIETWTWPEKRIEALTIYFLDNKQLLATHYCPLGNQPTLKYIPFSNNDNRFDFHFISVTNLPDHCKDHCESFWIDITGADEFIRSESYRENGTLDTEQSTYRKVSR